jgi:hypothetical protein
MIKYFVNYLSFLKYQRHLLIFLLRNLLKKQNFWFFFRTRITLKKKYQFKSQQPSFKKFVLPFLRFHVYSIYCHRDMCNFGSIFGYFFCQTNTSIKWLQWSSQACNPDRIFYLHLHFPYLLLQTTRKQDGNPLKTNLFYKPGSSFWRWNQARLKNLQIYTFKCNNENFLSWRRI